MTASRLLLARLGLTAALGAAAAAAAPTVAGAALPPATVVRNTNDSGPGSLRAAIASSNAQPGRQTITFQIPGAGVQTITPLTDLPQITAPVTIDGYSQSGATPATATSVANPLIVIDGQNVNNGLDVESSNSDIRGLVIHSVGNYGAGIFIGNGSGNVIAGNNLGVGANGFKALPNYVGVAIKGEGADNVIGGPDPADRNLISANTYAQVSIDSFAGNVVEGNRIGTNATGTAALSSTGYFDNFGVLLASDGSTVKDNVISNMSDGAEVWGDDNVIQGNLFGTNADGTAAIANNVGIAIEGADHTKVGGTGADDGNLLSGTVFDAVSIEPGDLEAGFDGGPAVGTVVQGNEIGTNLAGTGAIPNDSKGADVGAIEVTSGPSTIGGSSPGAANVIAGNMSYGIALRGSAATGTTVQGNSIGTAGLGNGDSGIYFSDGADANLIGGTGAGEGNTIAFNGGDGVTVVSSGRDSILGNSIHDNAALGIDLGADGPTADDAAPDSDTGANALMNFPVISSVTGSGTTTDVTWTLDSLPGRTYRIEFFGSTCDPSGFGEGETFLGSTTVTTKSSGHIGRTTTVTAPAAGQVVTATATLMTTGSKLPGLNGPSSTSELSACSP